MVEKNLLNNVQLREAENANSRLARLNEAEIKTRFDADRRKVEAEFRRRFGIQKLEDAVARTEEAHEKAEKALQRAEKEMEEAMATRIAELEEKKADSLAEIAQTSVERSFRLIAASLPADVNKLLGLDTIRVPKAIATEALKEGKN